MEDSWLEDGLVSLGFRAAEPREFDLAFVRTGVVASLAFLVKDLSTGPVSPDEVSLLVSDAKLWCQEHLGAGGGRQVGLNIVLLHRGQVSAELIKGNTDRAGMHASILQSITAIDLTGGSVAQEKTWLVLGRVRSALRFLRESSKTPLQQPGG